MSVRMTAAPHLRRISVDDAPKYHANQVTTAVNCSLESSPDIDPSDWMVEWTGNQDLSGYLQRHAVGVVAPTTAINRFRMLRDRGSPSTKHSLPHRKQSDTPVLTVLMAYPKRKTHRKVASLVHNPLSTGMALVRAKQFQTFTCPLALGPLSRPAAKTPRQKRCISVAKEVRSPRQPPRLQLSGIALTPERLHLTLKPTPKLSPVFRLSP